MTSLEPGFFCSKSGLFLFWFQCWGDPSWAGKCTADLWPHLIPWLWHFLWIFLKVSARGHPLISPLPLIPHNRLPSQLLSTKCWMTPHPGNRLTTTGAFQTAPVARHPESIMPHWKAAQRAEMRLLSGGTPSGVTSCHVTAAGPVSGGPPGCSGHCISNLCSIPALPVSSSRDLGQVT